MSRVRGFGGQPAVVDVIGEVEHGALGVHPERVSDEFGVGAVDQGGQPGAADGPRADAGRIE